MTPILEFTFPEPTPSNNQIMRMHFWTRKKENERVHWIVRGLIGPWTQPLKRCELHITRYGSRELDADNLAGGFKFLIDAVVNNRIILDDRPGCITRKSFNQERCKRREQRTLVRIYEVNP